MLSLMKIISITGLALIYCVISTHQQPTLLSPSGKQFQLKRAGHDANTYSGIPLPLFRGSNFGYFVRKRPFMDVIEDSNTQHKDTESPALNHHSITSTEFNNEEQYQRRFDDYSDNPGPMFGR